MRWDYNQEYRDMFDDTGGNHVDILIVPHATNVTPVEGKAPIVTSKVPAFNGSQPRTRSGEYVYSEPEYIITNSDIVKEKFEYVNSINSSNNLTFGSCESAMVKFTIRNNKTWVPNDPDDESKGGSWVPDIPNLQKLEFWDEDRATGSKEEAKLIGEVDAHAIFKLYFYYNGDSSNIIYMGMFMVEEDKASNNGYEREITAYDFMTFLRDLDCFEWYKRLFYPVEAEKDKDGKQKYHNILPLTDTGDENGKVSIKTALENFFKELHFTTGARTVTTPQNYQTDDVTDPVTGETVSEYPGPGLPIRLDDDLFDNAATYAIPGTKSKSYSGTDPDTGETVTINLIPGEVVEGNTLNIERYGYLPISELYFYKDDKILKNESLSFGKFLEDIGTLSGRYPFIRNDYLVDGNYDFDKNKGTTYENCVLSFKPLPKPATKKVNGETVEDIESDNMFDNNDIAKGFQHDYYDIDTIYIFEIWNYNDKEAPMISFRNLTKKQAESRKVLMESGGDLKKLRISNNTFTSYLDPTVEKHKAIITALAGNATKYASYNSGLFKFAHDNMKYRTYCPYELQTYADPCRDPGDRIQIHYEDRITGEVLDTYSYILEMKLSGIQKMMGTYTAKGDMGNITFSDYKTGTKYSASSYSTQSFAYSATGGAGSTEGGGTGKDDSGNGITAEDFVEIIRNIGFRLLNEPGDVSVKYIQNSVNYETVWSKIRSTLPHDERYLFGSCLTEISEGSTVSTLSLEVYDIEEQDYITISCDVQPYDTVGYPETWNNGKLYTFGTDLKWHEIGSSNDDKSFANNCGDALITYIQDGDTNTNISYYTIDENVVTIVNPEITYGSHFNLGYYGGSTISYTYMYPGFWWKTGMYPYGEDNFSGDDDVPTLRYLYNIDFEDRETELINAKNHSPGSPQEYDDGEVWTLNEAITDGSTQNPLVYTSNEQGTVYSLVRIYTVAGYANNNDETISDPTNYFIYGEDNKWHEHIINKIGDIRDGDTVPTDINEGDTTNPITINGNSVTAKYGDYIINYSSESSATGYEYIYPGLWYHITASGDKYPKEVLALPITLQSSAAAEIKWSDPVDITTNRPVKADWAGTIVVRKENAPPKHKWDGELIVNSTVRDQYKTNGYIDDTIEVNKTYFYGIFPYDDANPAHYRFTKVVRLDTLKDYYAPEITDVHMGAPGNWDGSEVAILYSGQNNRLTVQVSNSSIVFKLYTGNVQIYSWTSPVGSSTSDIDKIHVSFLKDDTNEVAKPSFIYETGSNTYSYNQESPSASEMADIYSWLAG